ncbi:MAG: ATP-binding protein [Bacteroidota bacterium]
MEKISSFFLSFLLSASLLVAQEGPPLLLASEENLATLEENMVLAETWTRARVQDSAQFFGEKVFDLLTLAPPSGKESLWVESIIMLSFRYLERDPTQNDSLLGVGLRIANSRRDSFEIYLRKYQNRFWNNIELDRRDELDQANALIEPDSDLDLLNYYLSSSSFYMHNEQFLPALEDLQTAKKRIKLGVFGQITVDHNLGIIYLELGAYEEAVSMFQQMLQIADSLQEPTLAYSSESLLGEVYERKGETELALSHLGHSLEIAERHQLSRNLADVHHLVGWVLLQTDQLDSARFHFQRGIELSRPNPEEPSRANSALGLSEVAFRQQKYADAIEWGEQGLPFSGRYYRKRFLPSLAEAYARTGQLDSAYQTMATHWVKESHKDRQQESFTIVSTLLENQYKLEREKEQRATDLTLFRQRGWGVGIIGGLILLGLGLALAWKTRTTQKLKSLNEALSHRNQNLQHFSYIASHDLKEPLRNISTFAGLLQMKLDRGETGEELKGYLDFILKGATTLQGMIKSLHTYTRVSFGQQKLEEVHLPKTLEEVREHLLSVIESNNGRLSFRLEQGTGKLVFEKNLLFLILKNLVQNGFTYNQASPPEVEVAAKPHQKGTLITVTDNGIGIDPEYQKVIFQPFKSLENKTATQSSGLGLAICQNILDNYGGRIELTSALGEGSTFRVWIPELRLPIGD